MPQSAAKLVLQSTARMCELHVQRQQDRELAYHSTFKGELMPAAEHGACARLTVDLQASTRCCALDAS